MNLQRKNDKWKKENVISEYFRYSNSGEIGDIKSQKSRRRFYVVLHKIKNLAKYFKGE